MGPRQAGWSPGQSRRSPGTQLDLLLAPYAVLQCHVSVMLSRRLEGPNEVGGCVLPIRKPFFLKNRGIFLNYVIFFSNISTVPAQSNSFQSLRRLSAGLAGHWPADVCHTFRRPYPAHELTPARHLHGTAESRNRSSRVNTLK